jgi:DNA repair protein RadC
MTKQIVAVAKPLGILAQDHITVGKQRQASFRGLGLI